MLRTSRVRRQCARRALFTASILINSHYSRRGAQAKSILLPGSDFEI